MKKGILFAILGLIFGAALGLGIRTLEAKLGPILLGSLEDEMKKVCDCSLAYDSAKVSLITLRAKAKNVRMMSGGKPKLSFDSIKASFGFPNLGAKTFPLTRLELIGGFAQGVSPESETFKFIDSLTQPGAPSATPKWHIKLLSLFVRDSKFIEKFSGSSLHGEGLELSLARDESDNFVLKPSLAKLFLHDDSPLPGEPETDFPLGQLKSDIYLTEPAANFRNLDLTNGESLITGSAKSLNKQGDKLDGSLSYYLRGEAIGLPDFIIGTFTGTSFLDGSLGNPKFSGSLGLKPDSDLKINLGSKTLIQLDSLKGNLSFDFNHRFPLGRLKNLRASGGGAELQAPGGLRIDDDAISGDLVLKADRVDWYGVSAADVDLKISLGGVLGDASAKISGTAGRTFFGPVSVPNLVVSARSYRRKIAFDAAYSDDLPRFKIGADFTTKLDGSVFADSINIDANSLPLFPVEPQNGFGPRITAAIKLKGPLDLGELSGTGSLRLSSGTLSEERTLQGNIDIAKGTLASSLSDRKGTLKSDLTMAMLEGGKGELKVSAKNFLLEPETSGSKCSNISLDGTYAFAFPNYDAGAGQLNISGARVGCDPFSLNLKQAVSAKIAKGAIQLPPTRLLGASTSVDIQGSVGLSDGFNLQSEGAVDLQSLLGFMPSIDDLRGRAKAKISVTGALGSPSLTGVADISKVEVVSEALDLSAQDISGRIRLDGGLAVFESVKGDLNGGGIELTGGIDPISPAKSNFGVVLKKVAISPIPDSSLELSGSLALGSGQSSRPKLEGQITIDGAEFSKNLDLVALVKSVTAYLFTSAKKRPEISALPDMDLNVGVEAPRGIFISTNIVGAELGGKLDIGGTLPSPSLKGSLETLSGWIAVKDKRFDITSGKIFFSPGSLEPMVEVLAESSLRGITGQTSLVLMEASGSLYSPQVKFSSDSNLSQKDILALITLGSSPIDQTRINRIGSDSTASELNLFDEDSGAISRLLGSLTKIDNISIDPVYNIQSGLIEPMAIAQKRLTQNLSIYGESSLSTTLAESRARAVYGLTPKLNISGLFEPATAKQAAALGVDLSYTVLAERSNFLDISLTGLKSFEPYEVLRGSRLGGATRLAPEESARAAEGIASFLRREGFFAASAEAMCERADRFCRSLKVSVTEGPRSKIASLSIKSDAVPDSILSRITGDAPIGAWATERHRKKIETSAIRTLRAEGFIGARASASYEVKEASSDRVLALVITPGKPVSFSFSGNKLFSAKDFLDTINLFNRHQPFGPNTINILVENIERKYREAGRLFASVGYIKDSVTDPGRVNYIIQINEDAKIRVGSVIVDAQDTAPMEDIERFLDESLGDSVNEVFWRPKAAIAEQVEVNAKLLQSYFVELGYPTASVEGRIVPDDAEQKADIVYKLTAGSRADAASVAVQGLPEGFTAPTMPSPPYSIPKINKLIEEISSALSGAGYLNPEASSRIDPDSDALIIVFEPGTLTRISDIRIEGGEKINRSVVSNNLLVRPGDAWNAALIDESRRRLLTLGLFSRVVFGAEDGEVNSAAETLRIQLTQKELTTLDVGGGANSEFGAHIFGQASDRSFFGDGRALSLRLDTYYDPTQNDISKGVGDLRFSSPTLFGTRYSLTEDLRFQKQNFASQEYDLKEIALATNAFRNYEDGTSLSFGHTILEQSIDNVSPGAIVSDLDSGILNLSFLSGSVSYDQRDNSINPNKGFEATLDSKLASETILSDANFVNAGLKVSGVQPLRSFLPRFSFAASGRVAGAWTFAGTPEVPITQRFYLGGRNSIRGFREDSLGPRGSDGAVIGGDTLFASNFEFRYLAADAVSVHAFFDAGTVWLRSLGTSWGDIRESVGLGVRFISPIGPIGFDLGHPLDERSGEPSVRLHFTIGSNF